MRTSARSAVVRDAAGDDGEYVPIAELHSGTSPRLAGEDEDHVLALAGVDSDLPPILVHRSTMKVIDGMHRLRAAALRGESMVYVSYFDGSPDEAFVEAVRANVAHGKPLTLVEREAAARRILCSQSQWSDRAIADTCGISARTVSTIRRSLGDTAQSGARVGRDGRVRPVDISAARARAAELFDDDPEAPLRRVAQEAGIALATARDVRLRGRRGVGPRVSKQRGPRTDRLAAVPLDPDGIVNDEALNASESGRAFVRWMMAHAVDVDEWEPHIDQLPVGRVYVLADVARHCANVWQALVVALEERSNGRR
jgi:ParB-like chromosome segregation protein Spo0J